MTLARSEVQKTTPFIDALVFAKIRFKQSVKFLGICFSVYSLLSTWIFLVLVDDFVIIGQITVASYLHRSTCTESVIPFMAG